MKIGVLHPGEMGSSLGDALVQAKHQVFWASVSRSELTRARATGWQEKIELKVFYLRYQKIWNVFYEYLIVKLYMLIVLSLFIRSRDSVYLGLQI